LLIFVDHGTPARPQPIDPAYLRRPSPRSSNPPPESKSLLVLFFKKEQSLLFLKKKKQKDFYSSRCFTIIALSPNQPLGGKRDLSIDFGLDAEVSS
jgi:hypothetical protein